MGAGGLLVGGLALWAYLVAAPPVHPQPRPVARPLVDLAVACLALGRVEPPLEQLSGPELDDAVEILARLIAAYGERDFDSFLALRAADLAHAEARRRDQADELRALCIALGRRPDGLPSSWRGLLEAYWTAYYVEAPVARFRPEETVLAFLRAAQASAPAELEAWEAGFERLCAERQGFRLDHRPVVPHRRSLERVVREARALRWLDLQLAYDAHDGAAGWLIARFVWDARVEEWFLHRATTVLDGELRDDRRHLVL